MLNLSCCFTRWAASLGCGPGFVLAAVLQAAAELSMALAAVNYAEGHDCCYAC